MEQRYQGTPQSGYRPAAPDNQATPGKAEEKKEIAKAQAQEAKDRAQAKVSEASDKARAKGHEYKEKAMAKGEEQASEAARRTKEYGRNLFEQQRHRASDEIGVFSSAMREASEKLHAENDDNIAHYIDAAADNLDKFKHYLDESDPNRMMDDVQDLAHRQPGAVVGGMFVAGLAIARFLKASRARRYEDDYNDYDDEYFYGSGADPFPAERAVRPTSSETPQPPNTTLPPTGFGQPT